MNTLLPVASPHSPPKTAAQPAASTPVHAVEPTRMMPPLQVQMPNPYVAAPVAHPRIATDRVVTGASGAGGDQGVG